MMLETVNADLRVCNGAEKIEEIGRVEVERCNLSWLSQAQSRSRSGQVGDR